MERNEKQGRKQGLVFGLVIGGASLLALTFNKQARRKVIGTTKQTANRVNETTIFIAENREEILSQIKKASNQLSDLLKMANQDIQLITERANHLKQVTKSVKDTTQQTAVDFKEINKNQSEESPEEKHFQSDTEK